MLTISEFLDSERATWDNREKALFYLSIPSSIEKEGYILDYLSENVADAHEQNEVDKHKHLLSRYCENLYDEMVDTYLFAENIFIQNGDVDYLQAM